MTRRRINLNREWRFFRGDTAGADQPGFDDSQWQSIGLPHTFDLPYFRTPQFYVGVGWYHKIVAIPSIPRADAGAERGKQRFSIEFDGAFQLADLFVNGSRAGNHRGGYTGFCFDITNFIEKRDIFLAVRVSNEWNAQLCPRAGEHIFSGGLYRDVRLVITDPLHIAWNGISVTTPQVSHQSATLRVRVEVQNDSDTPRDCTVSSVFDHPAQEMPMESTVSVPAHSTVSVEQQTEIRNPSLWHPDHPHLYKLVTNLFDGDERVDAVETSFGIRWFEWTADRGFFLNSEHLYLRGANAHQDHAGWGIGVTRDACERDVRLLKEAGFNFVRGAHYPHHPAFADACDRLGLIFLSENCFWGKGGYGPEGYWNASAYPVNERDFAPFEEHCKQTLREMIRINRNHPSIVAWSMTNEAFFTYHLDRARKLIADLAALSREADPTRPVAIGGAQRGGVDTLGDIACYNGDGARLFIDPGVPNMVSEYGAISKPYDAYEPFFGDLQPERFAWRSGEAIWCGFDYGSIAGKQGLKGILNHARLPKRSWHWYRNDLRGIAPPDFPHPGTPRRLQLSADKTVIHGTDATDDCQIIVTVRDADGNHISNCPPVALTIESGPGEFPTGRSIRFDATTDIGIVDGEAAIAFRSYHGGESVIRASSPGLEDATITIRTEGEPSFVKGRTELASRPYTPPPPSQASIEAMRNAVDVALNRPSCASGEHQDHPARFANDGNPATFWAGATVRDAWWRVDLEGFYQVSGVRLVFPSALNWRYLVELSNDARDWETIIDRRDTQRCDAVRDDITPPGAVARYVRIIFADLPDHAGPALSAVEVSGVLSVR